MPKKKKKAAMGSRRRQVLRSGSVAVGDGRDVDHRNGDAMDNSAGNIRAMSRARNLARKRKGLLRG